MKIVTGGAGFIGSRIISKLNDLGSNDILVVDDLSEGIKMKNLANIDIADYMDADDFIEFIRAGKGFGKIDQIFHMGACSSTTEWNGKYVMQRNYQYSKDLLHWSSKLRANYIYASSASVYGDGSRGFSENPKSEHPINMYAYSKYLFDQYIRRNLTTLDNQVVGLRFFNVYGPHEDHKGPMSSVVFHANNQIKENGKIKLYGKLDEVAAGEQKRDFVYVDDCVNVALWMIENPHISGIFNLGTGKAETFNLLAQSVIKWHGYGEIEYVDFPDHLKDVYQNFTQADLNLLRSVGYKKNFRTISKGVFDYLDWMNGEICLSPNRSTDD